MIPSLFIVVARKTKDRIWNRFIISLVVVRHDIPNMMNNATTVMTKEGKHSGEGKISGRKEQATAAMGNGGTSIMAR